MIVTENVVLSLPAISNKKKETNESKTDEQENKIIIIDRFSVQLVAG